MKKRIVCVLLAMLLVLGYANATVLAAEPHYYATALQEFMKDATGKTTAVLYDLDGDGNDEMIAFDEGIKPGKYDHWGELAEGDRITVYAIKNGNKISSTIEPAYTFTTYQVYIANKDYLVVIDNFEATSYEIYKYENGALVKETLLVDDCYANRTNYYVDGVECDELQFTDKLNEYGVDNVTVAIGYGQMAATAWLQSHGDTMPKDDTAKILAMTAGPVAVPTASTVLVNGKSTAFDAYNIDGNNYFKLRDLAYILNGTQKQFEVGWSGKDNAISLASGKGYTVSGGEMTDKGSGNKTPAPTSSKIYLDGKEITLTAYNIDGNNYFKLRDIGQEFDFGVDWDGAKNTIVIDTSRGYASN